MSRQFSSATVLRMVPNSLLAQFFKRLGLGDLDSCGRIHDTWAIPVAGDFGRRPTFPPIPLLTARFRRLPDLSGPAEGTGLATLNDSPTVSGHIPSNVLVAVLCEKQGGAMLFLGPGQRSHARASQPESLAIPDSIIRRHRPSAVGRPTPRVPPEIRSVRSSARNAPN
jgi:hypothetical protein